MTEPQPARRYRFGAFEADASTGELRRQGILVRLNAQPFQLLLLLLDRPDQLLTREEIARELWPDGTFVDYEHGVNSAINRIREALGDSAGNSRFVQTLARRGYRFVAPVQRIDSDADAGPATTEVVDQAAEGTASGDAVTNRVCGSADSESGLLDRLLATPEELPKVPYSVVRVLFVLLQAMYLGFYIGALANLTEIQDLLAPLQRATQVFAVLIVTAAILIPVRAFLLSAVFLRAPKLRRQFLKMWPFLLLLDVLWSLSPFLLLHHMSFGLALACATLLVYSPFAQRSLILMGAGGEES
jgi:cholera toxin transcriptional activator